MEEQKHCTRMCLREERGWTKKMTEVLLQGVEYRKWGNFYRWRNDKVVFSERYRTNRTNFRVQRT